MKFIVIGIRYHVVQRQLYIINDFLFSILIFMFSRPFNLSFDSYTNFEFLHHVITFIFRSALTFISAVINAYLHPIGGFVFGNFF